MKTGLPVSLKDVAEEMDSQNYMITAFIHCKTGELTILTEDDYTALRIMDEGGSLEELPPWQRELVPKLREIEESEDYIPLPSPYEIHEYHIMKDFVLSLPGGKVKDTLLDSIQGKGVFRRFKSKIRYFNIEDAWFDFKMKNLKEIARDFLEREGIPWVDEE